MPASKLGHTIVIANPASRSGKGERAVEIATSLLEGNDAATAGIQVLTTSGPGSAQELAAQSADAETVIALGGDGLVHDVVNGLMTIDKDVRPALGVMAIGSGNDYARTLGLTRNDPSTSLSELMTGTAVPLDLGLVNGTYFMETLSFGVDAAIALDTTKRRNSGSHTTGGNLYLSSGIRLFGQHTDGYTCHVSYDGGPAEDLRTIILAVQLGPTYGGGFKICPHASPADELLDVCYNTYVPSVPKTLGLFLRARNGWHVGSDAVGFAACMSMTVDFDEQPPAQADGEEIVGTHFEISSVPGALKVIVPHESPLI